MLQSKWQETPDLVQLTEGIFNGKLHFLCSVNNKEKDFDQEKF